MTIRNIYTRRGIEEVVHFTTSEGLLGILDSKSLKSRARLREDQRLEFILQLNAPLRKDMDWLDFVNLSITKINAEFFGVAANRWHPDLRWYILAFDPEILTHDGVVFATTNNIYPAVRRGQGPEGLEALFADVVSGRYGRRITRAPNLPANCTTDVQAEVLYPGEVSTDYLRAIYVPTEEDQDSVMGQISALNHPPVQVIVDPDRFRR